LDICQPARQQFDMTADIHLPSGHASEPPPVNVLVRIAAVEYLNTRPLIEGLEKLRGIKLVRAVPAKIIQLLLDNQAEIGLASIIDAAASPEPMTLLPVGMIGCDGATLTVRLYSKVAFGSIATLHADVESHTSVALSRILLAKQFRAFPSIKQFDAGTAPGSEWPEALLLIGDKVVTGAPKANEYPFQLDLGEAWKALTGLPFVYAMWMCPSRLLAQNSTGDAIRLAVATLDRQRRHNLTRIDWIVDSQGPAAGWPIPMARAYLGSLLRYTVGPRERTAVTTFMDAAKELQLIPDRNVYWFTPR